MEIPYSINFSSQLEWFTRLQILLTTRLEEWKNGGILTAIALITYILLELFQSSFGPMHGDSSGNMDRLSNTEMSLICEDHAAISNSLDHKVVLSNIWIL